MPKLTLSKSSYLKESRRLQSYERFLPPLDLKRKQLFIELSQERSRLAEMQEELDALISRSAEDLQMLANAEIDLNGLVKITGVLTGDENRLGVVLPQFERVDIAVQDYGLLTKPHWVDLLVKRLHRACELRAQLDIQQQRVELMQFAARKATQRVNLVSKILIPEAQGNMRKIQIFLSDNERAAVVRSKIAKKKKLRLAGLEL